MRALAVAVSVALLAGSGCFARQWYVKETLTSRFTASTCTVTGKERVRADASSSNSSRPQGAIQVKYRYTVDGRSYTGEDKSSWTPDFTAVGKLHDQIEVGSGYRCWIDPSDPRVSVMFPTSDTFVSGLGTVMLLFGAALTFFVSRQLED
jgi:hypothetical protein